MHIIARLSARVSSLVLLHSQSKHCWIELLYLSSRIIVLNIRKLYLYYVYFKLYVTLSGARQSLQKIMPAQHLEMRA